MLTKLGDATQEIKGTRGFQVITLFGDTSFAQESLAVLGPRNPSFQIRLLGPKSDPRGPYRSKSLITLIW